MARDSSTHFHRQLQAVPVLHISPPTARAPTHTPLGMSLRSHPPACQATNGRKRRWAKKSAEKGR